MQLSLFEHQHSFRLSKREVTKVIKVRNLKDLKGNGGVRLINGIRVDSWSGSPLGNKFYKEPRETSIPKFKRWLWEQMKNTESDQMKELKRLVDIYKRDGELNLLCWCAPRRCHAEVIRAAMKWMMAV